MLAGKRRQRRRARPIPALLSPGCQKCCVVSRGGRKSVVEHGGLEKIDALHEAIWTRSRRSPSRRRRRTRSQVPSSTPPPTVAPRLYPRATGWPTGHIIFFYRGGHLFFVLRERERDKFDTFYVFAICLSDRMESWRTSLPRPLFYKTHTHTQSLMGIIGMCSYTLRLSS